MNGRMAQKSGSFICTGAPQISVAGRHYIFVSVLLTSSSLVPIILRSVTSFLEVSCAINKKELG